MAKPRKKAPQELTKEEAKARFERTVRNMLNTPPKPHDAGKKKRRGAKPAAGNLDR